MIRDYKKRFVRITMALVGSVLFLALLALGIYLATHARSELKRTMSQVIGPLNELDDRIPSGGGQRPGTQPGENDPDDTDSGDPDDLSDDDADTDDLDDADDPDSGDPDDPFDDFDDDRRPDGRGPQFLDPEQNRQITIVFSEAAGSYNVFSEESTISSERLAAAVPLVRAAEKEFGTLPTEGLIYYKAVRGKSLRIAFVEASGLYGEMLRSSLILLGVFLLTLGLFLLISIRLSHYAARPMEEAMERERTFVADISHDLKTPITVIKANNSILRSSPEATVGSQTQWLDSNDSATDNMLGIINEMLTLSQLEGEAPVVKKEPVNLSEAAEGAVLQLESVAYERGITLTDELEEGILIEADPDLVPRVIGGLLENALKYEPAGGLVSVTLRRDKKNAVLSVRNKSSVIAAEDLPHVFDRFYRGDKTRGDKKGHGLGLSIVKKAAELCGGTITVTSAPETGTEFQVRFQ